MAIPFIQESSYTKLLKELKREITEGVLRARQAYEVEKIIAYWKIGKSISKHLLQNSSRADYGKQLYMRLSHDLSVSERLLYQISQFYNTYPHFKPSKNLKWSHYRLLTSIKNADKRNLLEHKASNGNWSKRALEDFLKGDTEEKPPTKPKKGKLTLFKGRLYTYEIFKDEYADNLLIDCGFNIYKESEVLKFKGPFVETVKVKDEYEFVSSKATRKHLYTYKAYVKKVIDGDTLWVNIDCGFKIWYKQKIRFRGIDASSIESQKGIEAFNFVNKALKGLTFIIIKTHGRDKYGRYLADVFYLERENDPVTVLNKGLFLNQQLLDEGLARRV